MILELPGAVVSPCLNQRSCSGIMGAVPDIMADPVGVRLLESCFEDPEGKLMTLPDAALATGEEAPEVPPPERKEEDLPWPFQADLTDSRKCFGPDFFLPPDIWD